MCNLPLHALNMSGIASLRSSSVMRIHVPVTKTSPMAGVDVFYARSSDVRLCPLTALQAYLTFRQRYHPGSIADPNAPLLMNEHGQAFTCKALVEQVRITLRAVGMSSYDLAMVSGHSFRRGGAQSLQEAGLAVPDIMRAGRWRSTAVQRYLATDPGAASKLATLFASTPEAPQSMANAHQRGPRASETHVSDERRLDIIRNHSGGHRRRSGLSSCTLLSLFVIKNS